MMTPTPSQQLQTLDISVSFQDLLPSSAPLPTSLVMRLPPSSDYQDGVASSSLSLVTQTMEMCLQRKQEQKHVAYEKAKQKYRMAMEQVHKKQQKEEAKELDECTRDFWREKYCDAHGIHTFGRNSVTTIPWRDIQKWVCMVYDV